MTNTKRLKGQFIKLESIAKQSKKKKLMGELHTINRIGFNSNRLQPSSRGQL